MSATPIVIAVICILLIAYRLYGTFMAAKVLKIKDDRETPAHKLADGKDYVPTNKWVSFDTTSQQSLLPVHSSDLSLLHSSDISLAYCGS